MLVRIRIRWLDTSFMSEVRGRLTLSVSKDRTPVKRPFRRELWYRKFQESITFIQTYVKLLS